jgi:hypothetical protein
VQIAAFSVEPRQILGFSLLHRSLRDTEGREVVWPRTDFSRQPTQCP